MFRSFVLWLIEPPTKSVLKEKRIVSNKHSHSQYPRRLHSLDHVYLVFERNSLERRFIIMNKIALDNRIYSLTMDLFNCDFL